MSGLLRRPDGLDASLAFFRNELLFFLITTGIGTGLFVGLMLMEFARTRGYLGGRVEREARLRGDSISSTRALELDDRPELPPTRETD